MHSTEKYDIIIVGTGAGGGTLARKLAPSGKRILILERGDYVPREKANWEPKLVNLEGKYHTKETWHDEQLYHVHGQHGEDPTSPPSSTPYPHPPVSHEPRIQELSNDLAALGLRPFHTPLGIKLNEKDRQTSPCIRCDTCDGFPCLINAKADAQTCGIDPALAYPNVTLLTNAMVERLDTSPSGREVTKVVVCRDRKREEYSANVVVLSCGAINSAALLLRSANDQHPRGLVNISWGVCHDRAALYFTERIEPFCRKTATLRSSPSPIRDPDGRGLIL